MTSSRSSSGHALAGVIIAIALLLRALLPVDCMPMPASRDAAEAVPIAGGDHMQMAMMADGDMGDPADGSHQHGGDAPAPGQMSCCTMMMAAVAVLPPALVVVLPVAFELSVFRPLALLAAVDRGMGARARPATGPPGVN